MTLPDTKQLADDLKSIVTSDENKLIVANLALQTSRIATLALTDPAAAEREMSFVRASTANLAAAEAVQVQVTITAWFGTLIRSIILGA